MKILVVEDESVSRLFLTETLAGWGYQVVSAATGREALACLAIDEPPSLALVDWMMPEMDGLEFTRTVRLTETTTPLYIIVLTARSLKEDVVDALRAGADDYLIKPPDRDELHARLQVGVRTVTLQATLAHRAVELQAALDNVKQLEALLPICSYCHKIRSVGDDDETYWSQMEHYITVHTGAMFSHGVCPSCQETKVKPELEKALRERRERALVGNVPKHL